MAGTRGLTAAALGVALAPWVGRCPALGAVEAAPVVACSGGADSVALLALVVASGRRPTAVHVDHGLRSDSGREGEAVAAIAARFGVSGRSVPVVLDPGPNLEARARAARYAALDAARVELGATSVLVGHTADDQAETVVLNLLRGSAAAGLGGMPARRGTVVRPLLGLRRADTEAICATLRVDPVRDPMNADPAFRRVRVRTEVLPHLATVAGRDVVPVLARQAEILRTESDYLDELARAAWPPAPGTAPAAALGRLPLPLARRAVRQWVGRPPPSFAEVERILAVARGEIRATDLAGRRRVERRAGALHLVGSSVGR